MPSQNSNYLSIFLNSKSGELLLNEEALAISPEVLKLPDDICQYEREHLTANK